MEPDQIIERLGSEENPPTVEELSAVQAELTEALATVKTSIREHAGSLAELRELKKDLDAFTQNLAKIDDALAAVEAERESILAEVGDPEDEADEEEETGEEVLEPEAVAASLRGPLARVRQTPTRIEVNEPDLTRVSTSYTVLGRDREEITPAEVGRAFADTARSFGSRSGQKTPVVSIKTELSPERTLGGDGSANERKMLDLFGANPVVPVTAAGGCCSIPEPIYDQPMLGDLSRPIRAAFDVLNASRGAVQAYPPICIPDEGADVWTCVQDEAVTDDPETWKTCVALECDTEAATLVEPIYKCLTVGTFQERFAPEQWEAFIFQTDKLAARLAEARLFDWLAAASTSVYESAFETGSTYANFIKQQIRIAAAIRQEQRLGDAQLITVGSNLIYSAIAEDTLTRRLNTTEDVQFFKDKVDSVLREFGITYVGSDDVSALDPLTYSGTIPGYPDELPMVTLPAGSAKVLDGGEKNLGVDVVDFDLARQNRIGAFSEFWEGLLVRNCNVVFSTVEVEECTLICPANPA